MHSVNVPLSTSRKSLQDVPVLDKPKDLQLCLSDQRSSSMKASRTYMTSIGTTLRQVLRSIFVACAMAVISPTRRFLGGGSILFDAVAQESELSTQVLCCRFVLLDTVSVAYAPMQIEQIESLESDNRNPRTTVLDHYTTHI